MIVGNGQEQYLFRVMQDLIYVDLMALDGEHIVGHMNTSSLRFQRD
jgi:hypothetical protein